MTKARRYYNEARSFVADYTDGLNVRDLKRMFGEDATKAFRVLSRDQGEPASPKDDVAGFLHGLKVVFLGISHKLSPARRLIFACAVLATLLGLLGGRSLAFSAGDFTFSFGTATFYLIVALCAFAFLFTMELVDRIRVRDELEVARQLQNDLLPQEAPSLPGFAFAHSYRTANEVGGDYFDVSLLADGRVALIIGDASGHGIAAGLLMAIANATLKTALEVDPHPAPVARLLNSTLYRTGDRRAFMTLFYALLDPVSGQVDFICAGHPFPLLRKDSGAIEELGRGALPLGMRPEIDLTVQRTRLDPGDTLLLFTDGLPEALDSEEKSFSFSRLESLIREGGSAPAVHDRVVRAFEQHVARKNLEDDVTLLAVSREP